MNEAEADNIEVHFDPRRGELRLTCGSVAFARLLNALAAEGGLSEFSEIEWETVQRIELEVWPRVRPR